MVFSLEFLSLVIILLFLFSPFSFFFISVYSFWLDDLIFDELDMLALV